MDFNEILLKKCHFALGGIQTVNIILSNVKTNDVTLDENNVKCYTNVFTFYINTNVKTFDVTRR